MTDKKRPFRDLVNKLKEIRKERPSEEEINELNRVIEESNEQAEKNNDNNQEVPEKVARDWKNQNGDEQRARH